MWKVIDWWNNQETFEQVLIIFVILLAIFIYFCPMSSAQEITLSELNVSTESVWELKEQNTIFVISKDLGGNLTEVSSLNITLLENITYLEGDIVRIDEGFYSKDYWILDSNFTNLTFNITATNLGKEIIQQINVKLDKGTTLSNKWKEVKEEISIVYKDLVTDRRNLLYTIITIFAILVLWITIKIFTRKKK